MRILKKGAEASIILGDWFGEDAIFKVRELKSYRQSNIDTKIRVFRTLHEASFLTEAKKIGVITPLVYFVDRQKAEIVMQFVNGLRLKDIVNAQKSGFTFNLGFSYDEERLSMSFNHLIAILYLSLCLFKGI